MPTAASPSPHGFSDAARSALSGFIDYAGLFPPAALSMDEAVAEFVAARAGAHGWMLGRFLCPASRLAELADVVQHSADKGVAPFRTRVVFDGDSAGDVALAHAFAEAMTPGAGFDMIEVKWADGDLDDLLDTVFSLAYVIPAVEIPPGRDVEAAVATIAEARRVRGKMIVAKLRCGGLTADAFPTAEQVAGFVDDRDSGHFELGRRVLRWGEYEATAGDIDRLQWESMIAYGSCDFAEPVEALTAAGILPVPDPSPPPPNDR